jgi:hypothetical protein
MEWVFLAVALVAMAPAALLPFLQTEEEAMQRAPRPAAPDPTPLYPRHPGGIDAAAA